MRDDEIETLNRMRNRVLYDGYKNSIIEWMLSDRWIQVPHHPHIRYECVKTYASDHGHTVKLCAEGLREASFGDDSGVTVPRIGVPSITISGEINAL